LTSVPSPLCWLHLQLSAGPQLTLVKAWVHLGPVDSGEAGGCSWLGFQTVPLAAGAPWAGEGDQAHSPTKREAHWALVAHACNPSDSGGSGQEDRDWKPAGAKSPRDPISESHHKDGLVQWLQWWSACLAT
jgi:hypothetical protein